MVKMRIVRNRFGLNTISHLIDLLCSSTIETVWLGVDKLRFLLRADFREARHNVTKRVYSHPDKCYLRQRSLGSK